MAKGSNLVFLSARELGGLLKSRQVSPVEVVEAHLERVKSLNPILNAFITTASDYAITRARKAEKEILEGNYLGPLHGVPYAPKDIVATKGISTTNGSRVTANWIPDYESTITERLNNAGAVLIGKTNLLEFAIGSGIFSGFGQVRNPWHLDYSAAGSSHGSGAALAAGMVPLSIGTDTGGSIRAPAAFCGVVGLKPTYGRVSRYGVTTLSWTLDHVGPMSRTVADIALLLQVIAGADSKDTSCANEPVPDYNGALVRDLKGVRIGVQRGYFFDDLHPDVDRSLETAMQKLKDLGAIFVDVEIPHLKYAAAAGAMIGMAEAATFHQKRLRESGDRFDPLARERIERGNFVLAVDYIKAQRVRTILMEEMAKVFRACNVLVAPSNMSLPTVLESAETAASDVKPEPVPEGPSMEMAAARGAFLGNMAGLPAISVPCGFSSTAPTLPIAIQFYAKPFDEPSLLRVGYAYEMATDWHERRPPV